MLPVWFQHVSAVDPAQLLLRFYKYIDLLHFVFVNLVYLGHLFRPCSFSTVLPPPGSFRQHIRQQPAQQMISPMELSNSGAQKTVPKSQNRKHRESHMSGIEKNVCSSFLLEFATVFPFVTFASLYSFSFPHVFIPKGGI